MKKQQGFTLVEVTIILLVLVILSTIMLPQLGNYNRLARFVKAREDVGALCASIKKMLDEVMLGALFMDPRPNGAGTMPVGIAAGPGSIPQVGSKGSGSPLGGDTCDWRDSIGTTCTASPGGGAAAQTYQVRALSEHLQENDPAGNGSVRYKNPTDNPARHEAGAYFGWRGPYFDELTSDPWGNRYAVNAFGLHVNPAFGGNDAVHTTAVVCYSAGVDGGVDTLVNQPADDSDGDGFYGWQFGNDDIGAVLSAGGPF